MLGAILAIAAIVAAVVVAAVVLYDALTASRSAADKNFSSNPVGGTAQSCPLNKSLKGKVRQLTWGGGIAVSRKDGSTRATVPTPHWVEGSAVNDGSGSLRPGVLLLDGKKGTGDTKLQVEITENVNVSGNGIVRGTLGSVEFEGSCPTAVGVHDVALVFKTDPDSIQHLQGDVGWGMQVADLGGSITLANSTRLEAFAVLDTPASFYNPFGVWVEVLRFMCDTVAVTGKKAAAEVATLTAQHCHASHGLGYDTYRGAPKYGCGGGGGTFKLESYLAAANPVVNCYDQAAAMQALCGAVGAALTWTYMDPFGFIHSTDLVGVGQCNSPFFSKNASPKVVPQNDPRRSSFGNHAFTQLAGKVLDACAGPHTASEDAAQYVTASIDSATTLYSMYVNYRAGTAADMSAQAGVSQVV